MAEVDPTPETHNTLDRCDLRKSRLGPTGTERSPRDCLKLFDALPLQTYRVPDCNFELSFARDVAAPFATNTRPSPDTVSRCISTSLIGAVAGVLTKDPFRVNGCHGIQFVLDRGSLALARSRGPGRGTP